MVPEAQNLIMAMIALVAGNLILSPALCRLVYNTVALLLTVLYWRPISCILLVGLGTYHSLPISHFLFHFQSLPQSSITFICLFTFKFLKVFVHTISYLIYRPVTPSATPAFAPRDVTVVVPTVGDLDDEFVECIQSLLATDPFQIIISTVGEAALQRAERVCQQIDPVRIRCIAVQHPNKRNQVVTAIRLIQTAITVLADDHVFWPKTFLKSSLTPFDDPLVGHIGTAKRVRRVKLGFCFADFLNYIACIYIERHNFEYTASNRIDGGVRVISGRTCLLRTSIVQDPAFQHGFLNETWFFGLVGPLNVDDDNFITRFSVNRGHKIIFHNAPEACMETTLGTFGGWTKFRGQLNRWCRTQWRSNTTTLFADCVVWRSQPWCVYAAYLSSLVNFALFYDLALFETLWRSPYGSGCNLGYLGFLLLVSKVIKPFPHLLKHPRDVFYLPFGILFGYYHSWVNLYALLTCWNAAWGTRVGVDGPQHAALEHSLPATDGPLELHKQRQPNLT
ncbi:MAG: hypothetical protein M1818_007090 [Claussenomyces sp. TS43310]|nr:MAG: hypothetical protein M1818_007090 [Claussenomyces sp. TS43310]